MYNLYLQHHEFLFFKPDFNLEELKTGFFVITIDLAEGGGADSTVFNIFQMTDKDILKHIGYWKSDCVDLDHAALEFWLLASQLFNGENCIWSLEWNTYGALFYRMLLDLNENEFDVESGYRFNISPEGLEISNFVMYKKKHSEEDIVNSVVKSRSHSQFVPGIKLTPGNKPTACSLLKIMFEKHQVTTTDLITLGELENFEDKNGNGTYKASSGHDDLIMTFVQLPMLMQTSRYKNFVEDYLENQISLNHDSKWSNSYEANPFDYNNSFNNLFGPSPIPGSFEIFSR